MGSADAQFNRPCNVLLDSKGNVFVAYSDGKPATLLSQIGKDPSLWKDYSLDQYGIEAMANGVSGLAPLHTQNKLI